jgi:glycosyltransferase involved in cell wall biosynthesis
VAPQPLALGVGIVQGKIQHSNRLRILRVILGIMKVIVVSQALNPQYGGSAVSEASLCGQLQTQCPTVVFCRSGALDAEFARGFGLTDVKEVHPFDVVRAWRDPSHWISRELDGADLLHINGHWRWENILLARLAQRKGVPFVLHPRGMLWLSHRKVRLKKLFNHYWGNWIVGHAQRLVALSRFEMEQWKPYGIDPARCEIIANGVPMPCSKPLEPILVPPFFLYFGRLESRKNLLFLVRAFAIYVRDGGSADLVFVGPAQRGYDAAISACARQEGISHRVRLLPPTYGDEKKTYLRQALAVIYPAVGEPFGRVPFETVSAGGIPLVPRQSGCAEYLAPLLPNSLYPIDDANALVCALRETERLTPAEREALLAPARLWIEQELNWKKVTQRVLRLYADVIHDSKHSRQPIHRVEHARDAGALGAVRVFE